MVGLLEKILEAVWCVQYEKIKIWRNKRES